MRSYHDFTKWQWGNRHSRTLLSAAASASCLAACTCAATMASRCRPSCSRAARAASRKRASAELPACGTPTTCTWTCVAQQHARGNATRGTRGARQATKGAHKTCMKKAQCADRTVPTTRLRGHPKYKPSSPTHLDQLLQQGVPVGRQPPHLLLQHPHQRPALAVGARQMPLAGVQRPSDSPHLPTEGLQQCLCALRVASGQLLSTRAWCSRAAKLPARQQAQREVYSLAGEAQAGGAPRQLLSAGLQLTHLLRHSRVEGCQLPPYGLCRDEWQHA